MLKVNFRAWGDGSPTSPVLLRHQLAQLGDFLLDHRKLRQHLHVDFLVQREDFEFSLEIDLIVLGCFEAIPFGLAVLGHHDDRRLDGGDHGEDEVEEDERVGIEGAGEEYDGVDDAPEDQEQQEADDEGPGASNTGDAVGEAFAIGRIGGEGRVDIGRDDLALMRFLEHALFCLAQLFGRLVEMLVDEIWQIVHEDTPGA